VIGSRLRKMLGGSLGPPHYLFAFVFLLRLLNLLRFANSPLFVSPSGDMRFYNDWAQRILHGQLTDHLAFFGLPLYAYLLACFYKLFGYNPFIPALAQSLIDAGLAVIIYHLGIAVFHGEGSGRHRGHTIGLTGALGWAFFLPAQAYALVLMPTVWMLFVFWFVVWAIVRNESAFSPFQSLLLGVLVGLTATGIATILFLVPLLLLSFLLRATSAIRRYSAIALLGLGLTIGTSPCWIHNYFIARDPVLLSAHSGINFWLGNNPDATGYPHFPGLHAGQSAMLEDSTALAQVETDRRLKRSEVSAYWSAKAKSYIARHPMEWLGLLARKLSNFWNAFPYDDVGVINTLLEQRVILPGLRFGLVAAFALPGALLAAFTFRRSRWIVAAILLHMVAILAVFVTERYRLAVVPGLLVLAAYGLWTFWENSLAQNYRAILPYLGVLIVTTVLVSLPRAKTSLWALEAYNSGRQALEAGDLSLAEKRLAIAHAYVPENAETNFALGNLRLAQENKPAARDFFFATLRFDPRHKGALNNLGILASDESQWELAIRFFKASIQADSSDAKTHYLLARAELESGDVATASSEIQMALRLKPDQPEFGALHETIRARQ